MKLVSWDIETLQGFFCIVIYEYSTKQKIIYEISPRKNQLIELKLYLKTVTHAVSFNGVHFDDFVLNWLLAQDDVTCEDIYKVAQSIIEGDYNSTFYKSIKKYKWKIPWVQIDLFLFWSKNLRMSKKLSLKSLAHVMGMSIIEMPIHHTTSYLNDKDCKLIIDYCINDIDVTVELSKLDTITDTYGAKMKDLLKLRFSIEKEFGVKGATSMDAPKIASEYLLNIYTNNHEEKKELKRSRFERPVFLNGDYLPKVEFKTNFFKHIYEEMRISYDGYSKKYIFKNFDGSRIKLSYGDGGLHTINKNEKYLESIKNSIITSDVVSLYPNLLINYKFVRPHLYSVLEEYENVKNLRIIAKKEKDQVKNFFYKLILNSFTGILDNPYSWVYSPEYIMALRLLGQLILSRLIEECQLHNFKVISANTDGIEVILPKDRKTEYYAIVKIVEKEFNLNFEHEFYKSVYYYSVNDYYAFTKEDKVKTKGEATSKRILDAGNEFNIIPLAVQNYLEKGTDPENTIKNHKSLFDFCKAQKVHKKYNVYYNGKHIQQLNRYFVSNKNKGAYLYKSKDDKNMDALMKNIPVYICNEDIRSINIKDYPINYDWYILKAWEKIKIFEPDQLTLF